MRGAAAFEWMDHTADIRVRIRGADEADLYASAALTLTAILVEWPENVAEAEPVELEVAGAATDERVVDILRELLFRFGVRGDLWVEAEAALEGDRVKLRGRAVAFDPQHHQGIREIKAVTYHQLESGRDSQGWYTDVVLDV